MDAKDFPRHQTGNGKRVENVDKGPPHLWVQPSFALVVKAVHYTTALGFFFHMGAWCLYTFGDVGAFVVAAQQEEVFRKLDLVAEQEEHGLQTLFASIDIITQKQIVGAGWKAAHLKQL